MNRSITCMVSAAALGIAVLAAPPAARAAACAPGNRSAACVHHRPQGHGTAAPKRDAKPARDARRSQKEAKHKKPVDPHAPALDATTLACNDEYEANKAAIDGGGQSKAKFIKDCKNGTESIPGGGTTAGAPPPAVDGPPPDKPLPNASPTSGRPVASQDGDSATGSTKPGKPKLK